MCWGHGRTSLSPHPGCGPNLTYNLTNCSNFVADTLGFTTYPAAYLSPQASGKNLLIGANFASAGSGYDDKTALLSVCF